MLRIPYETPKAELDLYVDSILASNDNAFIDFGTFFDDP